MVSEKAKSFTTEITETTEKTSKVKILPLCPLWLGLRFMVHSNGFFSHQDTKGAKKINRLNAEAERGRGI
jgi:hypothetical protein